jgi:potassium uptake TrkH family protein
MDTLVRFGDKHFKHIVNIVFFLAILIILGQITESGFGLTNNGIFLIIYKSLNLLFSIISVLIGLYLFQSAKNLYVRLARLIFLVTTVTYFVVSVIWCMGFFQYFIDIEGFRLFLATFIGFLAISFKIASLGNTNIHPALLFVLSFMFLILFGAICLMMPAATTKEITFIQALFTSTSAVTVTGLAVLDTGKDYTLFGQVVILILIQLGGLGILTVTNVFALIFKSSNTFRNRMMVSDMIKVLDNKNTFSSLFKIIFITFLVEAIGALLIYLSIYGQGITDKPTFFAVFHSVSAFCNAGFSTLTNSLYESTTRFNYPLHLTVAWLIITGGISYSVMINHYVLMKNSVLRRLSSIRYLGLNYQKEMVKFTTNNWLIMVTTVILLVAGTVLFFFAEYNGTLAEHSFFGKIVVSFFNSVTPRTAGFNNINMGQLGIPSFMLIMALMWVGASPGSTGGGIKTTTFALALLSLWNQIIGKEKLVIRYKEIPGNAILQVNAVILLSIFAISFGTFLLSFDNPDILFKDLLFECISAYSTVGLSVGITPSISPFGNIVLIFLMFLGRVSFLTFLMGVFSSFMEQKSGSTPYYPKENVFIN